MDAPPVRYTSTPDGMKIAYALDGPGSPVVVLPFHHNHVELRWKKVPWVPGLAEHYHVLHYDSRGQGLSTRGLDRDPTIEEYRLDLEAALAASGLERFAMVAYGGFANVAVRYALDNPDRVAALVMICAAESHAAWPQAFFLSLAEENWELFLLLEQRASYYTIEDKADMVALAKAGATQADYVRMVRAFASSNMADALPKLRVPTLVEHATGQHWLSPEEGAALAAKIPGARLVYLDGEIEPDPISGVRAMLSFFSELEPWGEPAKGLPARPGDLMALSGRQSEVLALIARGKTNREIAEALVLSERTVERHVSEIYARLGVRNRSEATALAMRQPATA